MTRDLVRALAGGIALLLSGTLSAQDIAVRGRVVHATTGAPVSGADITIAPAILAGAPRIVRTDSAGGFVASVPSGPYWFHWRAIGFTPDSAMKVITPSIELVFSASPVAVSLDEVRVEARGGVFETELLRSGYRDREKNGFGVFFDRDWLMRRPPTSLRMLLRPWLKGCTLIFVDGARLQWLRDVPIEMVAGIEVYRRNSETPVAYLNPIGDCGSIIVWTTTPGS